MNSSSITLIGNIVATPEVTQIGNGQTKMSFSMACEHRFQRNNEWESKPSFFRVVVWRDLADRAKPLLEKGMRVIVTGRLDQRSWKDDDGKTNSMVEVVADDVAPSVRGITAVTRRAPSVNTSGSAAPDDEAW